MMNCEMLCAVMEVEGTKPSRDDMTGWYERGYERVDLSREDAQSRRKWRKEASS